MKGFSDIKFQKIHFEYSTEKRTNSPYWESNFNLGGRFQTGKIWKKENYKTSAGIKGRIELDKQTAYVGIEVKFREFFPHSKYKRNKKH